MTTNMTTTNDTIEARLARIERHLGLAQPPTQPVPRIPYGDQPLPEPGTMASDVRGGVPTPAEARLGTEEPPEGDTWTRPGIFQADTR